MQNKVVKWLFILNNYNNNEFFEIKNIYEI